MSKIFHSILRIKYTKSSISSLCTEKDIVDRTKNTIVDRIEVYYSAFDCTVREILCSVWLSLAWNES